MFKTIKNLFRRQPVNTERVQTLSASPAIFTPFSGNSWESDIYRAAVDAIGRNTQKLKMSHIVSNSGQRKTGDTSLNRILQVRPNPFMSAADWLYKTTVSYYVNNNSFSFLQKDDRGNLLAIWPLQPLQVEFVTDASNVLYCKFLFAGGRSVTIQYDDVFHIKRHFFENDLLGGNNRPIFPALDLAHTQSEGMQNAIKSGAGIRGLLRYNNILSAEMLKKEQQAFINDYLSISNSSGVVVLDSKATYEPLNNQPVLIDAAQLAAVESKIYKYLGIGPEIVSSNYTEDQFASFVESVLEPFALLIGLELTAKLLTVREQSFGNSILVEASRMIFASNKTKISALKELVPMGLISKNQALEILNLPTLPENENIYLQSLNYVDQSKIGKYQEVDGSEGN